MPEDASTQLPSDYSVFKLDPGKVAPLTTVVQVADKSLTLQIDTGAALSLISEATFRRLWPKTSTAPVIQDTKVRLRTYSGEELKVLGNIQVAVTHEQQCHDLSLLVVEGDGLSLLGRDWLMKFRLDWKELFTVQATSAATLEQMLECHKEVFKEELGTVEGTKVAIHVEPNAHPRFYKARPVPRAIRGKLELELDRVEREKIIRLVQFSDWAAPVVPVMKRDGTV